MDVLVVDDYPDAALIMCLYYQMKGYTCQTALTGAEAIALATKHLPDVAIIDIGLPDTSGFDVARHLRDMPNGWRLRIIAVSGWTDAEYQRRAVEAGFDQYLIKPVTTAQLMEAVR